MPSNKILRLVIDTNLWVSFLISNRLQKLDALLLLDGVHFLFSKELLTEMNNTITKPKLQKHFGADALSQMLIALDGYIEIIDVKSSIDICRDAKGNFLLALAKGGAANFLLTGDKDLLYLNKFEGTGIITIADFLKIHIK